MMDIDFSRKFCDVTLGEFLAAERTVGILTGWTVALFTAVMLFVGRWAWKKWQTKKAKKAERQWHSDEDWVARRAAELSANGEKVQIGERVRGGVMAVRENGAVEIPPRNLHVSRSHAAPMDPSAFVAQGSHTLVGGTLEEFTPGKNHQTTTPGSSSGRVDPEKNG